KKGIFSVMNYLLPLKGVGSFHCSANMGKNKETALFFGLSGTGKTTLSADPKRKLIGDDEHGWDEEGIFNFEGGCYAKVINLSKEKEPDIYGAIKRDALLENVVVDDQGKVDFKSAAKTENTRMGYPLSHIKNIVKSGRGKHPNTIVFLTCDSFGVLPPVARLNQAQAEYWYLSGYTAKVAGTERGVTEPAATFSSCFGGPFLTVHPTKYAKILGEKISKHNSEVYLVNTGWVNGGYGVGKRMDITATRVIIDKILDGSLKRAEYEELRPFGLMIPRAIKGVETEILNPKNGWIDKDEYERTAERLARSFIDNFKTFTDTKEGKDLETVGPII
ncbi:phosphoenolpyruvate carboxykinase (ATP), partial [Microgenomates group bacterium]|nr:phosphoenolpyruvate carboxykinase (ATP) [Microgenomates group bacterium]